MISFAVLVLMLSNKKK
ncbi:hypothetical protein [Sporolactobacillus sp. THM19-2]